MKKNKKEKKSKQLETDIRELDSLTKQLTGSVDSIQWKTNSNTDSVNMLVKNFDRLIMNYKQIRSDMHIVATLNIVTLLAIVGFGTYILKLLLGY